MRALAIACAIDQQEQQGEALREITLMYIGHEMHDKYLTMGDAKDEMEEQRKCLHPNCTCDDYCMADDPYSTPEEKAPACVNHTCEFYDSTHQWEQNCMAEGAKSRNYVPECDRYIPEHDGA